MLPRALVVLALGSRGPSVAPPLGPRLKSRMALGAASPVAFNPWDQVVLLGTSRVVSPETSGPKTAKRLTLPDNSNKRPTGAVIRA